MGFTDASTNDTTPALSGTIDDAAATVVVTVDGIDYAATNNGDGTWTLADNTLPVLADGPHTVSVTATDVAGNVSTPATGTVTVDATAPTLAISADDLALAAGETANITFTFSEAVAGFDATDITLVGGTLGALTTTDNITWTAVFTPDGTGTAPSITVADGSYTDTVGNPGTGDVLDGTDGFIVDLVAPVVGFTDASTNDTTPALSGTIDDAAATVVVTVDGIDYAATNNGDGTWTLADNTLPVLADGPHTVSVTATDVAGNVSTPATGTVTVDATAPTLAISADDLALAAGETANITFTFSEAVAGFDATDITLVGGTLGALTTTDNITWTAVFTPDGTGTAPSITVADGSYTDTVGNPGTGDVLDGTDGFIVDLVAPVVGFTDASTNDTTPALSGTIDDAAATVVVTVDGIDYAATNNGDGTWTLADNTLPVLADGPHTVSVTATDVAGNVSTPATGTVTVDATAPTLAISADDLALAAGETANITFTFSEAVAGFDATDITLVGGTLGALTTTDNITWTAVFTPDGTGTAPSITVADGSYTDTVGNPGTGDVLDGTDGFIVDLVAPVVGFTDASTNDTTPALSGTIDDAAATVVVTVDGIDYAATNNGDGTWTLADNTLPVLADGPHTVSVTATDVAGNVSTPATGTVTVDATAPTLAISADDLALAAGETANITFTFSEAVAGFDATDITLVGGTLGALTTTDNITWTAVFTPDGTGTAPSITVADGSYTDTVGNPGTGDVLDGTDGFIVDLVAPVVGFTDASTNDTTPALSGTIDDAAATVVVTVDGIDYAATNNGDGTWTLADNTLPVLADGPHTVSVTATDVAGNVSTPATGTVTVDATAPTLAISADDLALAAGETANITFTFSEAVAGFDATDITLVGGTLGALTTTDNITWTAVFTPDGTGTAPSITVADGSYTDTVGNPGTGDVLDGTDGFIVDLVAPVVGFTDASTNDTTPALSGTIDDAAATVVVTVDGIDYAATNNGDGTWTLADNTLPVLADGPHTVSVTATDVAGNVSTPATGTVTVDATAPTLAISADDLALAAGETANITFTFSEAVAGFDATDITLVGGTLGALTTTDNITWTAVFTPDGTGTAPSITVADGSYTDTVGNPGTGDVLDGTDGFIVDLVAPVVGFTDASTNDTTPALSGTIDDAAATVVVTVDGIDYAATNNGDGTWTLADNTLPVLADGPHTVSVTATDVAGNVSTPATGTVTVDATAPTLAISADDLALAAGETANITFTFSEAVAGFDATDITLVGGTLGALTTTDNITWTAVFTPDGTGTAPSITVADGSYTDTVGNPGTGDVLDGTDGFIVDLVAPVVGFTDASTNDTTPALSGTIDDAAATVVVTVDGIDYAATNNGDGTWTLADNTLPVLADGPHTVSVTATDVAGNVSTPATGTVTVDATAPTLAISADDLALAAGETANITFTFSEAVAGFDATDITLVGGTLGALTTTDNITWTAVFTPDGTGTAPSITVADGSYTDTVGNPGTGDVLDGTDGFVVDIVPPTLAITADDLALAAGETANITFTFSEAVAGFDATDITLVGGTLGALTTTDNITWTAVFTPDGTGTAPSITVADNTYTDIAGNLGTGDVLDGTDGFVVDVVPPTLAITADDLALAAGETANISFTFSEAVAGFDATDITLVGGTLGALTTTDNITWTAVFTPDGTGTAPSITVADNTYTDIAGNLGTGDVLDGTDGFVVDIVPPTLAISATDLNLALGESTTVTFTFSEAVTGFDATDVTLAGGTLTGLITADGGVTWTATFTQDGSATAPSISVADNTYTDLAGNLGTGANLAGLTSDLVAPTLAISATDLNLALGESTTVTFTFSEAVTGFDATDVTLAGGTLSGLTTADGGVTWTATFTQDGSATAPSISVADNTYTDLAGNLGTGANLAGLTSDLVAPTLAISATDLNLALGESTTVTFTFSEAVTGFDATDVTLAGGTLSGLTTADGGVTWTATFTQDGSATAPSISVADNTYTDLAGNLGTGANLAGLTSDLVAPTLAISATDLNLALGESTTVTFTFSEAVTGFDATDVTLAGGTLSGLTTADGGVTWTATFTQDGSATAPSISVADNTYTDLAGNLGTGANLAGLTSDLVAPTLAISATDLNLALGESTTVTFTFSEAVTGFDATDVTLAGGTLTGLTTADGGVTWTATFTQDGSATAPSISVADNTYTDLAGNLGTGANLAGLTSDVVAPTLAISATDLNLALGESTTVTFTFSEAVTGFDATDVTLAGGTLTGLTTADGGVTWTATFTQDGSATAPSISVADNTYTDLAGNLGTGANLAGLTSDLVAPTLAISATDLNLALGESTTVTFTFSEAVTGFDATDVTLAGGTLTGLTTADGGVTWTATFTQDGSATAPSISVADNTYTDLAGNLGTGANLAGLTSDLVAPTLAISATDLNLALGESTTVTFTFSEAVTGFDATDVTLAGGTLTGLTTADGGVTWTATFTQDGSATAPSISVADNTYTDLAGNLGTGANLAGLTSDLVAPTLAISATDLNLALGESTTVTFTFSEAVTGFDATDVSLAGGTLTGLATTDGGVTWTATFTQDGSATAPSITVANNTYSDLAGNLGTGAALAGLVADIVAPTLAISASDLNLSLGESTTVTFTFSEAVTGFDATDVTLAGGTLTGLTTADGGVTWTATFTQDGSAIAPSLSVANNTYTDLAGNLGTGANLAGLVLVPTITAHDNVDSVAIDIVPLTTTGINAGSATYLALIGVTEGLNVSLLGTPSVSFSIAAGHTSDATISYGALLSLSLLNDYKIVLQKQAPDGSWQNVAGDASTGLINVGILGGNGFGATITDLASGSYRAFMVYTGVGVGLLGTMSVVRDDYNHTVVPTYSAATVSGNVLTDDDSTIYGSSYVPDTITGTTVVSTVIGEQVGAILTPIGSSTLVTGAYGTLTISANGSYSYTPIANAANIGKVDSFTYTITDPVSGGTSTAVLHIQIGSPDVSITWNTASPGTDGTTQIVANADQAVATVDFSNSTDTPVDVASPNISINLIGSTSVISNTFTVGAGELVDVQVAATYANQPLLSALPTVSYVVQQFVGGVWVDTTYTGSATALASVGGISLGTVAFQDSVLHLEAGTYRVQYTLTAITLGVTTLDTQVTTTTTHLNNYSSDWIHGNIVHGDTIGGVADTGIFTADGVKLYVETSPGVYVEATGQSITTANGTFVINSNGDYDYRANTSSLTLTNPTDTINYKLVAANGDESLSSLTVNLTTSDYNTHVISTSANDTFDTDSGTIGAGSDTLIYHVLNNVAIGNGGNTGGNGVDTWTNFHVGNVATDQQADLIDIRGLLDGAQTDLTIGQYINVVVSGGNTTIQIDRDGLTGVILPSNNFTNLLVLQGVTTTEAELLANGQIIY
ncbi:BapA/Bap/LapF family large adhesin [Acinetobacter sp. XS-4]|nr:BapA/Bap/LapF family large adhesin [Acinetobacter sp. XS-4]USP41250.1 Ig-like domain-containing protein [Acinetobacter sp. XS-4]